jgi:hypothetical protein
MHTDHLYHCRTNDLCHWPPVEGWPTVYWLILISLPFSWNLKGTYVLRLTVTSVRRLCAELEWCRMWIVYDYEIHVDCVYSAVLTMLTYLVKKDKGKGFRKKSGNTSHYGYDSNIYVPPLLHVLFISHNFWQAWLKRVVYRVLVKLHFNRCDISVFDSVELRICGMQFWGYVAP